MSEDTSSIVKKIIYKFTKPLLTFVKEEDLYELRTKSAPPLNIIEEKKDTKKYVLCKPDGTPISLEDLSDVSDDSSEELDTEKSQDENKKDEIKQDEIKKDEIKKDEIKQDETKQDENQDKQKLDVKQNEEQDKQKLDEKQNENQEQVKLDEKQNEDKMNKIKCHTCEGINVKREKLLNDLLESYKKPAPYVFVPSSIPQIKYSVSDIMSCKEITPFSLKLLVKNTVKVPVNYKDFKLNKETILEKANFELNKLTNTNIKKIINNLRSLDLQTIEQSKFIGNLIVFKAINEPQYCTQYAMVVGALKKDFKSKEEKHLFKSQTAFFGTVLTSSMKILEEKIEWSDKIILDRKSYKNSFEYERAFEEQETKRYTKKKKTMGVVDFLCNLYNLDIITLKHIKTRLDELLKIDNEEVIEVLGKFIDKIGEKMTLNEKSDYANMICTYLDKNKDKYVNRVKFYIMDVLDRKSKWKKPVNKTGNTFALLEVEEDMNNENRQEYESGRKNIDYVASKNIDYVASKDIENDDHIPEEDIVRNIGIIYEDLNEINDEEDEILILDSFALGSQNYGKNNFFTIYLLECIVSNKKTKKLTDFFIKYFPDFSLSKGEVFDILEKHKNNLNEIRIDSPLAPKNYKGIIELFKKNEILDGEAYDKLSIN